MGKKGKLDFTLIVAAALMIAAVYALSKTHEQDTSPVKFAVAAGDLS